MPSNLDSERQMAAAAIMASIALDGHRCYVKTLEDEQVLQASILGVEKRPLPHLLAITNMIVRGIEVRSNIRHDNALSHPVASMPTTPLRGRQ